MQIRTNEFIVKVKKAELVTTMKANRQAHKEEFDAASVKYREAVAAKLDAAPVRFREGVRLHEITSELSHMPVPQDHTHEYDRAIRMMEMDIIDTVELTEEQFNQYVLDEWTWSGGTKAAHSAYLVGAPRR